MKKKPTPLVAAPRKFGCYLCSKERSVCRPCPRQTCLAYLDQLEWVKRGVIATAPTHCQAPGHCDQSHEKCPKTVYTKPSGLLNKDPEHLKDDEPEVKQ